MGVVESAGVAIEELSPRERSVLEVAATGASTKGIAAHLVVSPRTVESHLASIYRKLGVTSRGELVARLHRELASSPPAPTSIRPAAVERIAVADVFVGRSDELELIARAVVHAGKDRQRVVLIGGEPGAGKSALVAQAATTAGAAGSLVLVGGCDESLTAPFQPIADALGSYLATHSGALADITGPRGGALSALFPDLADRLPPLVGSLEGPAGIKMIVEATFDTLVNAGTDAPVVLVLEDLHWGDHATLEWLRMLAGTSRDIPLVVLATFRDTDLTRSHPLPVLLADLWREHDILRVNLGGLTVNEVTVLATHIVGSDVDNDLVERLHAQMGGNPFFTVQMLREVAQSGGDVDNLLPVPILEVIRQRVHRLGDAVATTLQVGAVLGEQIDINVLERSLSRVQPQAPPTLDLLDTAVSAGLINESLEPSGQFHFAHDLIRQAILNDIGATRQARIHGVIAVSMEELNKEDSAIPLRAIAEHFSQGASATDRLRGGEMTVTAAHEVPTRLSADDVVDLAERTMATLPDGTAGDRLRLELLSLIADAQVARFDGSAHRQAVIDAVEVAMRLGDAEQAGRALDHYRLVPRMGRVDEEILNNTDQIVGRLGPENLALRSRLRAFAAYQRCLGETGWVAAEEAEMAVSEARVCDDDLTLSDALYALGGALLGMPDIDRQLGVDTELVSLSRSVPNAIAPADGRRFLGVNHLALGKRRAFEADLSALAEDSERLQHGVLRAMATSWRALLALLDGDLDRAEEMANEVMVNAGDDPNFQLGWIVHLCTVRAEQRRLDELLPLLEQVAADHGDLFAVRALVAWTFAAAGQLDRAKEIVSTDLDDGLGRLGTDWLRPAALGFLAPVIVLLDDQWCARRMLEFLEPYAGQLLIAGSGTTVVGSADRFRGMLFAACGDVDTAIACFADAVALETSVGATTMSAHTCLDWAGVLSRSGSSNSAVRDLVMTAERTAASRSPWIRDRVNAMRASRP